MRIISGKFKGQRLIGPKNEAIRPTSDRIKESIFNILRNEVREKKVLDLFAGTGNLGIEALSRGAKKVFFVEKGRRGIRIIQRNLTQCGMASQSEIIHKDVNRAIGILQNRGEIFDIIFLDPPYGKGLIQKTLEKLNTQRIYKEDSILVIQHDRREPLSEEIEEWYLINQRRIGDTLLSFLRASGEKK